MYNTQNTKPLLTISNYMNIDTIHELTVKFLELKPLSFDELLILLNGYMFSKYDDFEYLWCSLCDYANRHTSKEYIFEPNRYSYEKNEYCSDLKQHSIDGGDTYFGYIELCHYIDSVYNTVKVYNNRHRRDRDYGTTVFKHVDSGRYMMINGHEDERGVMIYTYNIWCECEPKEVTETRYFFL